MTPPEDQDRFLGLLEEHRRILHKVAGSYGRSAEDRRDLEQEICVQLWRAFPRFDAERRFSTWMYRIALNVAISFARAGSHPGRRALSLQECALDPVDPRPDDSEAVERSRALQRCIQGLGELDRALLLLWLDEQSYREIGEVLGISETNVGTRISRLKERLRARLTPAGLASGE